MNPFDAYKLELEIIPGVLEQDWDAIEKKIKLVKPFTKTVHIDLLDGKFAPNTTWMDPQPFKRYTDDLLFEVHLMVENPLQYLKPFADAGFKRFIGQIEHMPDIEAFIAQGELLGEVGLALDTQTSVDKITVSYEDLDFLFIMTVKAGFSKQAFLPGMLEKVKQIRKKSAFIPIEIDGGVSDAIILQAKEAGATRFVSTGFLFGENNPHEQYKKLIEKVR
jgi:ribulose-phosphate 3-epimerase